MLTVPHSDTGFWLLGDEDLSVCWLAYHNDAKGWVHDSFPDSFTGAWFNIEANDNYKLYPNYSVIRDLLCNSPWIAVDY